MRRQIIPFWTCITTSPKMSLYEQDSPLTGHVRHQVLCHERLQYRSDGIIGDFKATLSAFVEIICDTTIIKNPEYKSQTIHQLQAALSFALSSRVD